MIEDAFSRIRNAPEELIATSNELVDLHVILLQIQKAYQLDLSMQPSSNEPSNHDVDSILAGELFRAQELVANLEALVVLFSRKLPDSKVKTDRIGWYRKRKTINEIKRSIKTAKTNLHFLLSVKMR